MSANPQSDPRVPLAERRTELAAFRTSIALDRTTLAWIRTTLTMSSFGLGMIGFFRTLRQQAETPETIRMHQAAIHFGVALVLIGVAATVCVAISHLRNLRKLRRDEIPTPALWPLSITIAILLALLALAGLWSFITH
jgi:inner membrane protein YidH